MINPISLGMWLWRALKGRSLTFAIVIALALMGGSVPGWLKWGFGRIGVPWYLLIILPGFLLGMLAKREDRWFPDLAERAKWAKGIMLGALISAVLAYFIVPRPPQAVQEPTTRKYELGPRR